MEEIAHAAVQPIGFLNQPREVTVDPITADSISGASGRLPEFDDSAYSGESRTVDRDLQNHETAGKFISARSGQAYWENDSYHSSDPPDPTEVSELTGIEDPGSAQITIL